MTTSIETHPTLMATIRLIHKSGSLLITFDLHHVVACRHGDAHCDCALSTGLRARLAALMTMGTLRDVAEPFTRPIADKDLMVLVVRVAWVVT